MFSSPFIEERLYLLIKSEYINRDIQGSRPLLSRSGCIYCDDTLTCETCGLCHTDTWEAQDCWSSENDPDYDPFDI